MKILLDNVDTSSSSGPNTFGKRLAKQFIRDGHELVNDCQQDASLVFIEQRGSITRRPIVQRLDGIWFHPEQYHTHNIGIKHLYDRADKVIWQTEFDRAMITHHWGERDGLVIANGIDLDAIPNIDAILASPGSPLFDAACKLNDLRSRCDRLFVCASNWHGQKRLKKNIELFKRVCSNDDRLIVLGKNPDHVIDDLQVMYLGSLTHELCLLIYTIADWMIHLAWLDHCPNVVVEALACGCPVICTDSGGTHEVVRKNGIVLNEDRQYNYELTDYDEPYELDLGGFVLPNRLTVDAAHLDIRNVAHAYVKAMEGCL